ncbi:aggregation-promoting factor [Streptococcus loxodontisalivarius]|uniref:LysM repeat protein n=1 Tax=Streptococcus loxodontisalivarius TaxID=1349415 RepID=A0ABS2PR92_9STRE|nr:LysM domain-containing protein [Streptococcus loxodontisalivarius]MBM7641902.1 LysM repeat protein [Streptococcus loxodontisalivarius]
MQIKSILENKSKTMKAGLLTLAAAASFILPAAVNADSYTVQSGDTLSAIAASHNTSVSAIASENNISDVNTLSVGQVLSINGSTDSTATTTSTTDSTSTTTTSGDTVSVTTGSYTSTLSAADYAAKEEIAQRESSGSYTATNGQYYGRYQLSLSYLNGDTSAENQERTADAYVASRYGSWSAALAFWNANNWY